MRYNNPFMYIKDLKQIRHSYKYNKLFALFICMIGLLLPFLSVSYTLSLTPHKHTYLKVVVIT